MHEFHWLAERFEARLSRWRGCASTCCARAGRGGRRLSPTTHRSRRSPARPRSTPRTPPGNSPAGPAAGSGARPRHRRPISPASATSWTPFGRLPRGRPGPAPGAAGPGGRCDRRHRPHHGTTRTAADQAGRSDGRDDSFIQHVSQARWRSCLAAARSVPPKPGRSSASTCPSSASVGMVSSQCCQRPPMPCTSTKARSLPSPASTNRTLRPATKAPLWRADQSRPRQPGWAGWP
jgi:hypothetical protein